MFKAGDRVRLVKRFCGLGLTVPVGATGTVTGIGTGFHQANVVFPVVVLWDAPHRNESQFAEEALEKLSSGPGNIDLWDTAAEGTELKEQK